MSINSAKRFDGAIRTTTTLLWPVSSDPLPANPFVTAFFTGLCGFCYRAPNGEVGFHHGNDNHKLQIKIYERPGCHDITPELPERIKRATLEIPSLAASNVSYYEKGSFARLASDDANDFRWLPDLDSDDFYFENVPKKKNAFTAKLTLRHGVFYTFSKTYSKFLLVNVDDLLNQHPFNQVAACMGAAIDTNRDVSLTIDNLDPITLSFASGKTYHIIFRNECEDDGEPCEFDVASTNEEDRNDFHHMRKVLNLPKKRTKFGLLLDMSAGKQSIGPPCETHAQLNDEAPCMGTGFGQTGGFP